MYRTIPVLNRFRIRPRHLFPILVIALSFGSLLVLPQKTSAVRFTQQLERLNRLVQATGGSEAEMKIFREGRDLIGNEEWEKAALKFREYINKYAKGKDTDAAHYWLAFALKKQEKYQEADRTLERLISAYPGSKWKDDANTMRIELASALNNRQTVVNIDPGSDPETKIVALQSLFQGNPERGAAIAAEILKRDSKASKRLKEAAISLLGQHHSKASSDLLKEIIRSEVDPQLRKTAIFWLGQTNDEGVLDLLKDLATTSTENEVNKAAVFAISQHNSPRASALLSELARGATSQQVRSEAIFWLGQRGDDQNVDLLTQIYDADTSVEIRKKIIFSISQMNNARAKAKLFDIARTADNPQTRSEAVFWIGQTGGEQGVDYLIQLYDGEKSDEVKRKIVFALSQTGKKRALQKLMDIARRDSSLQVRKEAIFWLGQSRDPEAVKFLEEILK